MHVDHGLHGLRRYGLRFEERRLFEVRNFHAGLFELHVGQRLLRLQYSWQLRTFVLRLQLHRKLHALQSGVRPLFDVPLVLRDVHVDHGLHELRFGLRHKPKHLPNLRECARRLSDLHFDLRLHVVRHERDRQLRARLQFVRLQRRVRSEHNGVPHLRHVHRRLHQLQLEKARARLA
jgi:hypothetical protein